MNSNTRTVWAAESYIGRTSDKGRMYVEARLTSELARPGQKDTDHRPVEGRYLELHITGSWKPYRSSTVHSCGQNLDDLADTLPEGRWSLDQAAALLQVWRRWHLNGMQAGCSAMPPFTPNRYGPDGDNWYQRPECPVRDYRWGQAWLLDRLPETVVDLVKSLPWDTVKENKEDDQ